MVAYNLMLAIFPFALLVLFVFGQVVDSPEIEESVIMDIQRLFPNIEQDALENAIDRVRDSSTTIGVAAVVGGIWIGASFWGAMDTAFCRIYHVECRSWVEQKRFALVMLFALTLLLAASVAVPAVESAALAGAEDLPWGLDEFGAVRTGIVVVGGFVITFGIVSAIYWAVPKGHMPWRVGLAGRALLQHRRQHRQLRLPALPDQRLRPEPDRRHDRLHPRRPALVLRGQPRTARRRRHQLDSATSATTPARCPQRGDGSLELVESCPTPSEGRSRPTGHFAPCRRPN